jgi:hypothetical protein
LVQIHKKTGGFDEINIARGAGLQPIYDINKPGFCWQ